MSLTVGAKLGPYEITAQIGAGGMGEVYLATDANLKRSVAIKVLPESVATDRDRLARFQREAEVLASLNHPNIAAIYGLERSDGITALVMELVEGPTLAERIAQGAIPIDEALPIAKQIAEALEAAHEQGIIHRDLKPANVKVRPDGTVKVLDFGLAKALEPLSARVDATASPTITSPAMMTGVGMLLGTAAYMSPEQARGKAVDKRSDIWAFGCVLYEMLTGQRAFGGEDVTETLASVVKTDPAWDVLPDGVSPSVRTFLRRCLQKNPKQRLHDIADMRLALEGVFESLSQTVMRATASVWPRVAFATGAALMLCALAGVVAWTMLPRSTAPTIARFSLTLEPGQSFTNMGRQVLAISPDGTRIAYVANGQLHLRPMWDREAKLVPGTETQGNVLSPVFSPDGMSIAFWSDADGMIKKVSVSGGSVITVCPAVRPWGISWDADGILFGQGAEGIMRVPADGGIREVLVKVPAGEIADSPQLLPGGDHVMFTVATGAGVDRWDRARIVVQSLRSGERKTVIDGGSNAHYLSTGHVVYARGGTLFAAPFDLSGMEVAGQSVPVVEGVGRPENPEIQTGVAHLGVSDNGVLVYRPAPVLPSNRHELVRVDRNGRVDALKAPPSAYESLSVSPDGTRIAVGTYGDEEANVWIYDVSGASAMRRLTFGGSNRYPVWSGDGERVAFQSSREGDLGIFWQRADGAGTAERLTTPRTGDAHFPESWAPTGERFLFTTNEGSGRSLWSFSLTGRKAEPFGVPDETATLSKATFSPDGRWVAYSSGESGTSAIYVQPFPASGAKYQIATPGHSPLWSRQGNDLFYVSGRELFVVSLSTQTTFAFSNPLRVPIGPIQIGETSFDPRPFDIGRDGTIFGLVSAAPREGTATAAPQIEVVLNWQEELKQRVPTR